jgi:hypothetical protein
MKRVYKLYDKTTNKIKTSLTDIALDKFVKSEYLRDTTTILPLTLLSIVIRATFNFLIVSRIKTNIYLLDFFISVIVTIVLAFSSPTIYNSVSRTYDAEIKNFSSLVIDSYWVEGWSFIERWKTIILGSSGVFLILILFLIEVNSTMIQEFIFHTMISSAIVDYLTKLKDKIILSKRQADQKVEKTSPLSIKILEKPSDVLSRANASYSNLSKLDTNVDYTEDYQGYKGYGLYKK